MWHQIKYYVYSREIENDLAYFSVPFLELADVCNVYRLRFLGGKA
jgi:hypothetical protein